MGGCIQIDVSLLLFPFLILIRHLHHLHHLHHPHHPHHPHLNYPHYCARNSTWISSSAAAAATIAVSTDEKVYLDGGSLHCETIILMINMIEIWLIRWIVHDRNVLQPFIIDN